MRRLSLAAAITIALCATPCCVHAQASRAMSIDDLLTAVRVGDPQLSSDGRRVLFTRTTTAMPAGTRNADIWAVPADGSSPAVPFIEGPKSDNSARFIPGSARVAFISSREGTPQVFLADADGRNAKALTTISGGVQPPFVVSPDGKHVAFVSDVYPSCADEACNARTRAAEEKDPVKVHTLNRLPFRHWNEWWETVRHHVFVTEIATGATRDVTPGDFDSPSHNYEDAAIAFSPDGREVAFVSKRDGKDSEMWTTNHDIWTVPVAGGVAKKVSRNAAADFQPVYSPDGKSIVVRAQRRAGFEADRWYLDVYDRTSGARRTMFTTPDLSVDDYRFTADGTSIWFTASSNGTVNLYSVPAIGGTPKLIARGGAIGEMQLGTDFAVFSKSTMVSPSELFRVSADGSVKLLTRENASWLSTVALSNPVSLTVTGAAAAKVQYWLLKPPNFDPAKKYPVVFMIHGGPQSAWSDAWSSRWNPSLWAAQGWVVAAPNPRGSTGFGQRFVDDISQDWCGKVMTDLGAVFNAVSALPYVDAKRAGIAGASYGGYAVDWLIGHTNRFNVAVSHDGVYNLESMANSTEELWFSEWEFGGQPTSPTARANFARCSPHLFAARIKTPTLVITNEQDFRVPVDQGLQLFTALRRNGVPSRGLVFPDEGHWVLKPLNSKRWHEEVFAWITQHINGGKAAVQ
jgi:dipeptidyl aminopeptidase/acylaminoacyl peptidase